MTHAERDVLMDLLVGELRLARDEALAAGATPAQVAEIFEARRRVLAGQRGGAAMSEWQEPSTERGFADQVAEREAAGEVFHEIPPAWENGRPVDDMGAGDDADGS